jgi:hypothetical protein
VQIGSLVEISARHGILNATARKFGLPGGVSYEQNSASLQNDEETEMPKKVTLAWVLSVLLLMAVSIAKADDLQLFTNRGDFGGDDSADWGQLGPAFTPIPNPFAAFSNGAGLSITGAFAGGGVGQVQVQTFGGWNGNFASGDNLVWTNFPGQGPLTLSFDSPQVGAGAQIQADFYGPFTAKIEAFNGDTSLGSFTENGNSTPASDNSAIFIGVKDLDAANITAVVFSLTASAGDLMDFAINRLSLDSGGSVPKLNGNRAAASASLPRN